MKTITSHHKHSDTGDLLKRVEYTETFVRGIPVYFYDIHGELRGENLDITGYVEISEKKWKRYKRKASAKDN